jgi:hypothetical protein
MAAKAIHVNLHSVWDTSLLRTYVGSTRIAGDADRLDAAVTPTQTDAWSAESLPNGRTNRISRRASTSTKACRRTGRRRNSKEITTTANHPVVEQQAYQGRLAARARTERSACWHGDTSASGNDRAIGDGFALAHASGQWRNLAASARATVGCGTGLRGSANRIRGSDPFHGGATASLSKQSGEIGIVSSDPHTSVACESRGQLECQPAADLARGSGGSGYSTRLPTGGSRT